MSKILKIFSFACEIINNRQKFITYSAIVGKIVDK